MPPSLGNGATGPVPSRRRARGRRFQSCRRVLGRIPAPDRPFPPGSRLDLHPFRIRRRASVRFPFLGRGRPFSGRIPPLSAGTSEAGSSAEAFPTGPSPPSPAASPPPSGPSVVSDSGPSSAVGAEVPPSAISPDGAASAPSPRDPLKEAPLPDDDPSSKGFVARRRGRPLVGGRGRGSPPGPGPLPSRGPGGDPPSSPHPSGATVSPFGSALRPRRRDPRIPPASTGHRPIPVLEGARLRKAGWSSSTDPPGRSGTAQWRGGGGRGAFSPGEAVRVLAWF